jgi:hypothetical protein
MKDKGGGRYRPFSIGVDDMAFSILSIDRELPPTGAKQWQPYFQKTFEIFSKVKEKGKHPCWPSSFGEDSCKSQFTRRYYPLTNFVFFTPSMGLF